MTGLDGQRVYLDWNATARLRPEARQAMLAAMEVVGNPSSVHAEGRAARALVEEARARVAALVGCTPSEIVFTSGATEACRLALTAPRWDRVIASQIEHDAVVGSVAAASGGCLVGTAHDACAALQADATGAGRGPAAPRQHESDPMPEAVAAAVRCPQTLVAIPSADGETGVLGPDVPETSGPLVFRDLTQSIFRLDPRDGAIGGWQFAALSAHKMGGPKGVGALVVRAGQDLPEAARGGGQEQGRRSGTEDVVGIAGFGAAAAAALRDRDAGVPGHIAKIRDVLEDALADAAPETIFFGMNARRLPNSSCFAVPGWAGETQVMQMDLSGFAVSAGSACSSGKVDKSSRVLRSMGFDDITAASALRVSLGPTTTEAEVMAFARTWISHYRRRKARAA